MRSCLMVMHARDIPECLLSLRALKIDKVWFRGFTEKQLEAEITRFVKSSDYERYILVSDDVIATQQALDNLLSLQGAGPVVTGWCNIFPGKTLANLVMKPIASERASFYYRLREKLPPAAVKQAKKLYAMGLIKTPVNLLLYRHFPDEDEIWAMPSLFRTYFVGWALTSISRDFWLRYGFHYSSSRFTGGHGSDARMSWDLQKDGVPMFCARDSFIYHLGTMRNFIVGKVPSEVITEKVELVA